MSPGPAIVWCADGAASGRVRATHERARSGSLRGLRVLGRRNPGARAACGPDCASRADSVRHAACLGLRRSVVTPPRARGRRHRSAAWGALVVSCVDNFIRPLVISGATRVPFLLIILGVLGGL